MTETAADVEAIQIQVWTHCWASLDGAREWRRFFASRYVDERELALARVRRGDLDDPWAECRRLIGIVAIIDADIAQRRCHGW